MIGQTAILYDESTHNTTPFTIKYEFYLAGWIIALLFELLFLVYILGKNNMATDILSDVIGLRIFPAYILIIAYLALTNLSDYLSINIVLTCALLALSGNIYYVYSRVKQFVSGNLLVSKMEYFSIHTRISVILSWVFLLAVHRLFMCLSFTDEYDGDEQTFLGWENSNWSILAMCLVCAVAIIFLTLHQDVFFALTICFGLWGIYFMQDHADVCSDKYEDNCSTNTGLSSLVLACVLLAFTIVVSIWHEKRVFNCIKRRDN